MINTLLDFCLNLIILITIVFSVFMIINSIGLRLSKDNEPLIYVEDIGRKQFEDDQDLKLEVGILKGKIPDYCEKGEKKLVILELDGDTSASDVDFFKDEVTAAINLCKAEPDKFEILIKINSGGGVVNGYGLLASQINRFKKYKIKTTASVDLIAASGGYLGACAADKIIAAPFAYIGSIGVISSSFNYSEILEKVGISFDEFTAGDSKSTVSQYRKINASQKEEYNRELDAIHKAFIKHVQSNRDIDSSDPKVFSGKHWLASEAIKFNLVDKLLTSDEFIAEKIESGHRVYAIKTKLPKREIGLIDSMIKMASKKILNHTNYK